METDVSRLEPYEYCASFVTRLALPEPEGTDESRGELFACLCHLVVRAKADMDDEEWASTPHRIKPVYALIDNDRLTNALHVLGRNLGHRMIAAKMAMPFIAERLTGQKPPLPSVITRLSISQMHILVEDDTEITDTANLRNRVWKPSLPVIHLATATSWAIDNVNNQHPDLKVSFGHLLVCPELVSWILKTAKDHALLLSQSVQLGLSIETMNG